jgi:hypothetical protein
MNHWGVFWRERFATPNPPERDRSMNDAALNSDKQDIMVAEEFHMRRKRSGKRQQPVH